MKAAYTPLELQSIVAQLNNVRVNGKPVFRKVVVEPTALDGRKRLVLMNYDTTANLEFILTGRRHGAWDGVLARYGTEDDPITYIEALRLARARIGETVPGYYEGEEWLIIDIAPAPQDNCIRAVVVDKTVAEAIGLANYNLEAKQIDDAEREHLARIFETKGGKPLSEMIIEDRGAGSSSLSPVESVTFIRPSFIRLENGDLAFKLTEYGVPNMVHDVLTRGVAIQWARQAIDSHMSVDGCEACEYTIDGNEEIGAIYLILRKKE